MSLQTDIPTVAKCLPSTRSRISNGNALFGDRAVDGRSKASRRFRDVLAEIIGDLGGADLLSEGQRQLARRAAMMCVECEVMEGKSIAGETIDLDVYGALSDRIGRAFQRLGLKRVPKVVRATLADHFDQPYARPVAAE